MYSNVILALIQDPTADDYDSRYIKGYPKLSMDFFSPIKAFRNCYDRFGLGKGGPDLEPHRISYGYVSRVFEAAAEAVLALSSAALSPDIVRSYFLLPCVPSRFQCVWET